MCAVTKGVSFSSSSFTRATNWHKHLHKTMGNVLVGYLMLIGVITKEFFLI